MKNIILTVLILMTIQVAYAQQNQIDSLKNIISNQRKDTTEVIALNTLAWIYVFINPDSSVLIAKEARDLARELNYYSGEVVALNALGEASHTTGDFPQALEALFNALRISRTIKSKEIESDCLDFIGIAYVDLGEYRQGLNYLFQAKKMNDKISLSTNYRMKAFRLSNIGHGYEKLGRKDSALYFQQQALIFAPDSLGPEKALILTRLGVVEADLGKQAQALGYYREAIKIGDVLNAGPAQYRLAELFYSLNQPDSSLKYARFSYISNQKSFEKPRLLEASNLLVRLYKEKNKIDSAFKYQEISSALKDSIFGPEKFHRLQLLGINEQQQQNEIRQEKERAENKIKLYALLATIVVFLLLAMILYRNNRRKKKANALLQKQKQEIDIQKSKAEKTLEELKSTQAQLIQSEKMASLGELTAGIAHEIQNPLNFVNNFSEVNKEMLEELKAQRLKPNAERDDDLQNDLINDVIENSEKILHHGKRADAIEKGCWNIQKQVLVKKNPQISINLQMNI